MNQLKVVLSVDCVCASEGKCYVTELVDIAEKERIPMTWLIGVAEHDPLSNLKLYHNEYFHRIPAWHELGLFMTFDSGPSNTISRDALIRIGKDVLKQFSIKATAFRAANGDLDSSDLKVLEDIGILVDSTPGSNAERPADAPTSPYNPSYSKVNHKGEANLLIAPVANIGGMRGYLDDGFDRLRPIIDAHCEKNDTLVLGMQDCVDNADNLKHTLHYLKEKGARFVTLTQLASEL